MPRFLLRLVQVFAVLLVVVFLPAVAFGEDAFTRVLGLVLAALGVGLFLLARRFVPRRPPPPPPPDRPPDDIEGVTVIAGEGRLSEGNTLRLDPTGFTAAVKRKTIAYRWAEIAEFRVAWFNFSGETVSRGTPFPGYVLREPGTRSQRWAMRVLKVHDNIPGYWERPAEEIVELLERYRQRHS